MTLHTRHMQRSHGSTEARGRTLLVRARGAAVTVLHRRPGVSGTARPPACNAVTPGNYIVKGITHRASYICINLGVLPL